jgi:protein-S-isoprenylcysteine O-methyltransferase Ste14
MKIYVNLIYLINCVSFLWAGIFFFKKPARKNKKFILINILGVITICTSCFYVLINENMNNIFIHYIGLIFLLFSFALFWFAIFECKNYLMRFAFYGENLNENFIKSGPYRFIRHPFYSSYSASWLGAAFITQNLILLALFFVMLLFYYEASQQEEASFLKSKFSEEYLNYIKKTGRFFPKIFF